MIVSLRHLLGWIVSSFRTREDLVLDPGLTPHAHYIAAASRLFRMAIRWLYPQNWNCGCDTSLTPALTRRATASSLKSGRLGLGEPSAARLLHHPQLVGNFEHVWYTVSRDVSQVLVVFIVNVAFQRYPMVFNNYVNAGRCLPEVPRQRARSNQ